MYEAGSLIPHAEQKKGESYYLRIVYLIILSEIIG